MNVTSHSTFSLELRGQWWAMSDGTHGKYGTVGNEESVTYRVYYRPNSPNPTLTARVSQV